MRMNPVKRQVWFQIGDQGRTLVRDQVWDQVRDQVLDQVYNETLSK